MKLNCSKVAFLAASLLLFVAETAQAADPVRIGISVPATGPASVFMSSMRKGADLAAQQINDKGGILKGRRIELIYEDDKGTPAGGVAAAQKLIVQDRVSAIGGGASSSVVLAQSAATKGKVLHVNSGAQADAITEQGSPYLFSVMTTVTTNAEGFDQYIIGKLKPKTVAFLGENGEYAKTTLEALSKDLTAAGVKLVDASLYDSDTKDFTSLLTRVKALDPDLIYVADAYPARYAQLWKQVRQVGGFRTEVHSPGVVSDQVLKALSGAMDGVYTTDIYMPGVAEGQVGKDFITSFQKIHGEVPGKAELILYETVMLIAGAMDKAGSDRDYPKIAAAMRSQAWTTPRGTFLFDPKGRPSAPAFFIQRVKSDKLVLVETQRK
ncbi:ABC transporter substrate-binding protein [Variovorax sp.]|jgi:branched-chain amino acid transport system substrate-binding protein|uniref:ABC transporter substrate-binding protein n=1 Tax=Variovorax sp. TaxID=1871043 RepID=UPI000C51A782|nr:ABC transporter substrate-binding protein [Variovorax sp.]MBS80735.1 branched-chain amino acid ABC transporter substrate-binding protein [Variovorax sp.]